MINAIQISIFGLGNSYRSDDGAGLRTLEILKSRLPKGIKLYQGNGDESVFMEKWQGTQRAYLVDAVSANAEPGTVFRFSKEDLGKLDTTSLNFRCSTHGFDLKKCIELAEIFNSLPKELVIYGIEAQTFSHGIDLSEPVRKAVAQVADQIHSEIIQLLTNEEEQEDA